ncbi:MAG: hypothetical protein KDA45_10305, partial [Planctomycetales bacterium]|nr:hypothetical protein [Planctomycetales bacterium]
PLVQFLKTGPEGGRYGFALGTIRQSDDRQQLLLTLDPHIASVLEAFGLAQELLARATPSNAAYDPSWAAILHSVAVTSGSQVRVQLKRPNVLPHALLQWKLPLAEELDGASQAAAEPQPEDALLGPYRLLTRDEWETVFALRQSDALPGQPREVIERFYDDPQQAVNDLLRGEIDILDQLYPADAQRLASDPRLRIGTYALPTTHMLLPVSQHVYLSQAKFRRALLYATNRQAMLSGELLHSDDPQDGRLVSAPFPLGAGSADPLSYAYNTDILPAEYNPQLAKLLLVMTQQELREQAKRTRESEPQLKKLVVGCPDFEFARVAVQAMIQQWANVGIEAEMLVLPTTDRFATAGCDLLYVTTTLWEPATDIERLLGDGGVAASDNPFIVQSLEQLRVARNWREVRTALQDLHQLIDYHLPLLPLWQIADRFAVRGSVEGVGEQPVSLYQDIDAWRVKVGSGSSPEG